MSKRMERAASILLRHVDTSVDMASQAALRAKIVERVSRPRGVSRGRLAALVFVPAALAIVVLLLFVRQPVSPSALTFSVGTGQAADAVGSYLVPVAGAPLPIRFSDGSVVTLSPSARARVSSATAHGARLLLETGQVRCEIIHRPGAQWGVTAGPYTVEVKGTAFDVSWNMATSTIELQMRQGVVTVRGPGVESGIELRDTQRFVGRPSARAEVSSSLPAPTATELMVSSNNGFADAARELPFDRAATPAPPSASAPATASAAPAESGSSTPAPAESAPPAAPVSWPTLASRGDYARIVAEAEARGIDAVLASGSDAELAALGDACRFLGRIDLATRVLNATRSRFPGSSRAASAAYVLGRMADDSGNSSGALSWYDRYLAEAPGGALAPEAMGRRMLLLRKVGNALAAKQAAELYLQRFPKGPYSGVAKEMTSQ
jgi:TolA-binding protein